MSVLASIPSPSSGAVDLGPFQIHMYGLTLLAAIAVCIWITGHRYVNRGGDWDLIFRCAVWGVGAGIVGARLYHLATSWNEVPDHWWGPFAIWKGGLGVWGGIALGCIVGAIVAKRAGADVAVLADCLAPGLLVAQGIGRIGNWWNQELYGKATDLPWGLEIDPAHRPFSSITQGTYHPTFLYELLWDLFAAALLVFVIERRFRPRPPGLFALYIAIYSFGRFWVELVRIDPANHILGLRVNTWVSGIACIAGVVWFVLIQRRGRDPGQTGRRRLGRRRNAAAPPAGPKMAVPKGRVRPGG
jgi:prolipoprotein diacylglyceryl transferase